MQMNKCNSPEGKKNIEQPIDRRVESNTARRQRCHGNSKAKSGGQVFEIGLSFVGL